MFSYVSVTSLDLTTWRLIEVSLGKTVKIQWFFFPDLCLCFPLLNFLSTPSNIFINFFQIYSLNLGKEISWKSNLRTQRLNRDSFIVILFFIKFPVSCSKKDTSKYCLLVYEMPAEADSFPATTNGKILPKHHQIQKASGIDPNW